MGVMLLFHSTHLPGLDDRAQQGDGDEHQSEPDSAPSVREQWLAQAEGPKRNCPSQKHPCFHRHCRQECQGATEQPQPGHKRLPADVVLLCPNEIQSQWHKKRPAWCIDSLVLPNQPGWPAITACRLPV